MWAHIGTVECWFAISDTCIRSHGKPTRLFFQSSIQRFPGGLFLFNNKCASNKDTLVTYIGKCKSKHLEGAAGLYSRAKCFNFKVFLVRLRSRLLAFTNWFSFHPLTQALLSNARYQNIKFGGSEGVLHPIRLFYALSTVRAHTNTPPTAFQLQSPARAILFYLTSPPQPPTAVPSGVHFSPCGPHRTATRHMGPTQLRQ